MAGPTAFGRTSEDTTSRLKSVTDPKGNVKTHNYNLDDTLQSITYAEAAGTAATPDVCFTYDLAYNRIETMTDGTGTTTYAYFPVEDPPALGAGGLQSVDGPLVDDTIEYSYDELGRVIQRQIGSPANVQTQAFDTLGRLETLTNPLGAFTYTYDGVTGRPASLTYPNGEATTYDYYDNPGDRRLREIHNKPPRWSDAVAVRVHVRRRREHPHMAPAGGFRPSERLRLRLRSGRPAHSGHPEDDRSDPPGPEAVLLRVRPSREQNRRTDRRRRNRRLPQQHEPAGLPTSGRGARLQGHGE